ncbi:MAG: bifunctional 4'-phosphopantothenoylcysteine decarboxylase/phosphopantothenoylcysteine synthetase, partial [Desulfuromonadales bacterium]|nr:bifunctional 4'-phosphopantothenoylcysteine decarboxylase/phosphopantothenoylcysteine synthetase [Desulfuromonadales bacterium]
RPARREHLKVKKGDASEGSISLQRNPDILAELGKLKGDRVLIGFAAETNDLLVNAGKKLAEKNLDMIVANDVSMPGAGFDSDTNVVQFLHRNGQVEKLPEMSKSEVADLLVDRIVDLLAK